VRKAEVSWLDWDLWVVKCIDCGFTIEMKSPRPFLTCVKCGTKYFMTNFIFWKRG